MSDISLLPPNISQGTAKQILEPETNAAQNFRLGQILTAKVLRVYEHGSYLVEIDGRPRVVDSAIPLRQGEVFKGKVLELGERPALEKMTADADLSHKHVQTTQQINWIENYLKDELKPLVTRHLEVFDVVTWNNLIQAASRDKSPQTVIRSAIFLQKLGIPVTADLAARMARYIKGEQQIEALFRHEGLHVQTVSSYTAETETGFPAVPAIVDYLKTQSDTAVNNLRAIVNELNMRDKQEHISTKEKKRPSDQEMPDSMDQAALHWLMNTQIGGAVSHRLLVIPFVLNGKLVELEMAVFDQNDQADMASRLQSKVAHLSLQLAQLGKVDIAIQSTNENLTIRFSADSADVAQALASNYLDLKNQLIRLGYRVNELFYNASTTLHSHTPLSEVVNFVANAGSLSMLV